MVAKVAVIYSSTYGHIRTLAETIAAAAKETGAEVDLFQFPEILSDDVLAKMHAAPKADYPLITPEKLTEYDGFLIGTPTRYGRAVASASAFFDQTGGIWGKGALVGKFAGIFTSSASQHGGQETTALTTIPFLAHHGIAYVPIGFAATELFDLSEVVGGSAWGAAAVAAGDGSRGLTEKELAIAKYQGSSFAKLISTFVAGKTALAAAAAPIAAKAIPASATTEEAAPYEVTEKATESAPAAPATKSEDAPKAAEPTAAAATSTPAKTKKSGGFFCCGKADHYDS